MNDSKHILYLGMKSHQLLSDKDLQILKVTYRTVIENYYEHSSQDNAAAIILLNDLTMQAISTREQSDALLLVSMLQILKVKTKSNKELSDSIQNTIIHLKNPLKIYLKDQTIQQSLERIQIYGLCCTIINQFYEREMKPRGDAYAWKEIISKISKNSDKNMAVALSTMMLILPDFVNYSKQVSKSGMIKYLCSIYLPQVLQDKISLYRSLKVLKLVASNDRSVLPGRQKNIALVIYHYPAYILIVQEIQDACYDQQYALKVINNLKDIDPLYVWSYNTAFCQLGTQRTVDDLERLLKQAGKGIPVDLEWKIYAIINNLAKAQNFRITESWRIPLNVQKNLNGYLKLVTSVIERNGDLYKNVDIKAIQYAYDKCKVTDPLTDKLIKELKNLQPSNKKVGKLQSSIFQHYSVEKNPEMLMQKAAKIPKNNDDLRTTQQILNLSMKNKDELEADIIRTLKNKSLDSVRTAVIQKYPIQLARLFNGINLNANDPEIINKLVKLGQLALTLDPDSADKYNQKKFLQIIEWLENNCGLAIIDWVAVSQMLAIIFGVDEWKNHLSEIPKRCFWLLNASSDQNNAGLMQKINSTPLDHPKVPLIIGMVSKTSCPELKQLLLKSPLLERVASEVKSYKSSRTSTKPEKVEGESSDEQKMQRYLVSTLNLSYFIYNWNESPMNKQIEQKIIQPCLKNILRNFQGYEHEYRFIQNALPFKFNMSQLKDINLGKLLETHGKLASYLYKNKYDGRIDFSKISTVSTQTDPAKIQEILRFLEDNPDMIQCSDLLSLLDFMLKNSKKQPKYWKLYPNYMSILNHIADIATKSNNPEIVDKLGEILEKIIGGTAENQDITEDELKELYENIGQGVDRLIERKVKIDANRVKRQAEKIGDKESKKKIVDKLKIMNELSVVVEPTKVLIPVQLQEMKPTSVSNKYQSPALLTPSNPVDARIEASTIGIKNLDISKLNASSLQVNTGQFQQKKDQNILQGPFDTNEIIKTEENNLPSQSPEQQRLIDALKMLKKIIMKLQPKQTFPKLVQIFLTSQFNKNRRYILGHLLTEYYEVIQQDKRVIALLQMKDKTNLCKQVCYKFLSKFEEAFLVGKRWKLLGFQFVELAMQRVQCKNQNKVSCVENGCEIAEYNLIKNSDLASFQSKKYHHVVVELLKKLESKNQALYYFLLVGTSARQAEIKTFYISNKVHSILLDYANRPEWLQDKRISANLSYALSSLVYTQNHIAIEVASKKAQMLKLLNSYREFATIKPVIEAGCSLISNICYSNKQTKELMYNYGVNQLLIEMVSKNLAKPEVSTYKQIMRSLGNISLHKPSSQWLINEHVCQHIVTLAQKFNILIFRDDEKLKVLKLIVDFFSNLASHKFCLETLHSQGVTNFVITILETTQISEDQILMACIDTIDGLCQSTQIENYVVMDKKLLLQLIDLLKIKEDEKLITKSIRLLTNMTLNEMCIPYILQANLLSVLANIVLSVYQNEKINLYINKIIIRIFARKPDIKQILKSGYLDCLMKAIQITEQVDDQYIDILLFYCQHIPNYLNHRAFFNLVKVLTSKQNQKQIVDKCLKVIRVIFTSEEKEDDDIVIEGSSTMYEKLLQNNQANRLDIIYLIGIHCTKSRKFKKQLLVDHLKKKGNTLEYIHKMLQDEQTKELASSVLFTILNKDRILIDVGKQIVQQEDFAYRMLTKGFQCKLFRMDGSSKSAIVDINEMYMIRAYKYPDGEIKKKYVISIRQLRDWQFLFEPADDAWKNSVFNKQKGVFESKPKIQNCVTLLGSQQWGQFSLINLEFNDTQSKVQFVKAISALVLSFKV